MKLNSVPDLHVLLSTYISNAEPETDEQAARDFVAASSPERVSRAIAQAKSLLEGAELPLDELGSEANRWFGDDAEAGAWLRRVLGVLESGADSAAESGVAVKDSNGTPLAEGDAVTVIKDLKVKGGSKDLKRGTLIKGIRLVDDPENIECRVDGVALVLKTCFLKKA